MAKEVWDSTASALSDVVPIIGAFDVVVKLIGSIHETRPKVHKERVARLKSRIGVLDEQLQSAGRSAVETAQLQRTRVRLEELLEEALSLMRKLEDAGWIKRFIKKGSIDGDFAELNQRLSQESLCLILSLNIDAKAMQETFNEERRRREDERDRDADIKLLEEMKETLLDIKDDTEEIKAIVKETNKMVKRMSEDSGEKSPPPGLFSPLPPSYSSAVSAPPLYLPPEPGFCPYPQDPTHLPMPQPPVAKQQPVPVMTSPVTKQQPAIQLASPTSYHPQVVCEPLQASSPSSPTYQPHVVSATRPPLTKQETVIEMTPPVASQQAPTLTYQPQPVQATSPAANQETVVQMTPLPLTNQHPAEPKTSPVTNQPAAVDKELSEKKEDKKENYKEKKEKKVKVDFGTIPTQTVCPVCKTETITRVIYKNGIFTWAMFFIFMLFCLFCGCCLIPFFQESCKDSHHSCPRCNTPLSVSKKCC